MHTNYVSLSFHTAWAGVSHWTRAVFLVLAITCTGCVGVAFDRTTTETIENPIPLRDNFLSLDDFDRWACQPDTASTFRTKSDFLASWGEPLSKEMSAGKETWTYAESGRWCGVWIAYGVAFPILLPVCETYDKITFENDLAIRAISRRFVRSGVGLALAPYTVVAPIFQGEGKATQNRPSIDKLFSNESKFACKWKSPNDAAAVSAKSSIVSAKSSIVDSIPDTVSCISGGKHLRWVERSLCD